MPDVLYERLRNYARDNNCTISAAVLTAVERELARGEWRERLALRPTTYLGTNAASLVAEERARYDAEAR